MIIYQAQGAQRSTQISYRYTNLIDLFLLLIQILHFHTLKLFKSSIRENLFLCYKSANKMITLFVI